MNDQPRDAELARLQDALAAAEAREAATREREAALRRELQHRVRNMLAVVRSIFGRSVEAGGTLQDLANHFPARLDILARYQFSHMRDPAGRIDLHTILNDELQAFLVEVDPHIHVEGPEIGLPYDMAQTLALAMHELATNSIKFGVLGSSAAERQLSITWDAGDVLKLHWRETGVAVLGRAPLHNGFGRQFIEQGLPYQLGARTSFELHPGGLRCIVEIPLVATGARADPK